MKTNNKKKSSSKTLIIFVGVMLASLLIGIIVGATASGLELDKVDFSSFNLVCTYAVLPVFAVLLIAVNIFCFAKYRKAKKLFEEWDNEDEDTIIKAEAKINSGMCVSNVAYVLYLLLLGLHVYFDFRTEVLPLYISLITVGVFFIGLVSSIVIQRMYVELEKKINPEKKGELLDSNFNKEWIDSFDEAEKVVMYKASYKAFKATSTVCSLLWIVCIVGITSFKMSVLPLVMVMLIWLVNIIAYQVECTKLQLK